MTSPATNPGTVASGAVPLLDYRCTTCGRTFSGDAPFIRFDRHRSRPFHPALCTGAVVIDTARDDRAGVTLPTALEPVGGDQLVPGGAGQGDQGGEARRGHENSIAIDRAEDHVNTTSGVLTAVDGGEVIA